MTEFIIGDIIEKKTGSEKYRIESIKKEGGGNWHDGFSITLIATIHNILDENIKEEIHLMYHLYGSYQEIYVTKCEKKE